jgi:hypothetical protein
MSWPYIHLLLNHFPVILLSVGTVAALLALITRKRGVWMYAVISITLAGATIYPVVLTGDKAEHALEDMPAGATLPALNEEAIHEHEGAAEQAMWMVLLAGVISAYAWWTLGRVRIANNAVGNNDVTTGGNTAKPLPNWLSIAVVLSAVLALASVIVTSLKGGQIFHGGL